MQTRYDAINYYVLNPFFKAVNIFYDLPVVNTFIQDETDSTLTIYYIPVVGLIVGLIAYFFSIIITILAGTLVAAIICPFVIVLCLEYLDGGKSSRNLFSLISSRLSKNNQIGESIFDNFINLYVCVGIFAIRILALATLIYFHRFGWMNAIFILSLASQGFCLIHESEGYSSVNNFLKERMNVKYWILVFVLSLIFSGSYFFPVIFGFIITLAVSIKFKNSLVCSNLLDLNSIGVLGRGIEFIILILGLFYRFHL